MSEHGGFYILDDNEQPVEETGKYYYAATDITLLANTLMKME